MLGAAALSMLAAGPARAATLKVDDDGVQCPGAPYTTLQAAVAAAAAGEKIKVCPGLYGGQAVVNVSLKILGKAPKPKTCDTLAAPDPTVHSIFDAPPVAGLAGIGIDVLADRVTIQGLVVRNAGEVGIRTDPGNVKFSLKNNVFTQNANGVYFHSAVASKSALKGNCFHHNGTGVRTGYGLRDASIAKNFFFESTAGAAIILDQLSANTNDRVKVSGNRSVGDATFAVVLGTVESSLTKNTIFGSPLTGTAIFIGGNKPPRDGPERRQSDRVQRDLRQRQSRLPRSVEREDVVEQRGRHPVGTEPVLRRSRERRGRLSGARITRRTRVTIG